MIVGTTLMHDGTGITPYFTPTLPRGGEAAVFSVDVTHLAGSPTLVVTVEHKNEADTAWGTAATFTAITMPGVTTKDITSIKEEIRISFTFSAGSGGDFVHVVIPAPAWRQY